LCLCPSRYERPTRVLESASGPNWSDRLPHSQAVGRSAWRRGAQFKNLWASPRRSRVGPLKRLVTAPASRVSCSLRALLVWGGSHRGHGPAARAGRGGGGGDAAGGRGPERQAAEVFFIDRRGPGCGRVVVRESTECVLKTYLCKASTFAKNPVLGGRRRVGWLGVGSASSLFSACEGLRGLGVGKGGGGGGGGVDGIVWCGCAVRVGGVGDHVGRCGVQRAYS